MSDDWAVRLLLIVSWCCIACLMPSTLDVAIDVVAVMQGILWVLDAGADDGAGADAGADYCGTADGGLDWGICGGCLNVVVACCCVSGVLERGKVQVKDEAAIVGAWEGGVPVLPAKRLLLRIENGLAIRVRRTMLPVGNVGEGMVLRRAELPEIADVLPASVIVGAALERLAAGASNAVGRVAYRRRFSFSAGVAVLVPRAIPDVPWTFAHDVRLVRESLVVLSARDDVAVAASRKPLVAAEYIPLHAAYLRVLGQFLRAVRVHLLARTDVALSLGNRMTVPSVWDDDLWAEQHAYPAAQLSAFLRLGLDRPRDLLEANVWRNLSRYCRLIRSQCPSFVVKGSLLPPLSAWRMVAVAFAGAEVGCWSAEEHRRWIWLVRVVQGAAPIFCSPRLAGLALLAGNRHELRGLLACWVGVTGESFHFSGAYNLIHVTRAVAWLHLRPCAGAGGITPNLAPRANLLEMSVTFPACLIPEAGIVIQRLPVFDADVLRGDAYHIAHCDYVDVGRVYDFAPSVKLRRTVRSDAGIDGAAYSSDLPLSNWETAYHSGVLAAVPWVLGFVDHPPDNLEGAGVFVFEAEEEEGMGEE
jgi:hypothetical protein